MKWPKKIKYNYICGSFRLKSSKITFSHAKPVVMVYVYIYNVLSSAYSAYRKNGLFEITVRRPERFKIDPLLPDPAVCAEIQTVTNCVENNYYYYISLLPREHVLLN